MSQGSGASSQFQELISRAIRQQSGVNQRFADLLRRIASGELNNQEVREQFRQFSEAESAEYVRSLTQLGVSFFSHLLDLNQSFNERFFQLVGQNRTKEEPQSTRARISLHGALGATLQASFVVENRREQSADVYVLIPEIRRGDGSQFPAPFVVEPAAFRLAKGEERSIRISLQLLPELFTAGEEYTCEALVRGPEDMILDLHLHVDAETAEPVQAPEPARATVSGNGTARKLASRKPATKKAVPKAKARKREPRKRATE